VLGTIALLAASPAPAQIVPGHRLPEGPERPVRERTVDIRHVALDLQFDMEAAAIAGTATITLAPLQDRLEAVVLDAARLDVERVEALPGDRRLEFQVRDRTLSVTLGQPLDTGQDATLRVTYSARPKTGLYFFPRGPRGAPQAWNYGEGGLHYGWVPLYNDTNDRFTTAVDITVARPYVAISNGALRETRDNADGTRTFRWRAERPFPNYLLALKVGELLEVPLAPARVGDREIPLSAWASPGDEDAAAHTFGVTPPMVEFFSRRFGYPYPWAKFDQIALRDFAAGAMETTSASGYSESHLQRPGDPPDSSPEVDQAWPIWTSEETIAHELAHHWFGNLVTCRSLGSLWLNESFATFAHTTWNGEAHGEDDLTYERWRYLNAYLDYVRRTGRVRPMEYRRYESFGDTYQMETTYIKGALVLHMLRHIVGPDDFDRTLSEYLHRHEYRTVDSVDLLEAFRTTTGRDLSWFFGDWVVEGGGHPVFDVSWSWSRQRKQVDLTVRQVQADLPFEDDFRLPVEVEVLTPSGSHAYRVDVEDWSASAVLPSDEEPLGVVFDRGGWLVAEVHVARGLDEVRHILDRGSLAQKLRAARQLATDFPRRPETPHVLARVLADETAHWGLRQEAAIDLGTVGGAGAVEALARGLKDPDRRVRRSTAVALGNTRGEAAAAALQKAIETDDAEDVVAAAAASLGRSHAPGARKVLLAQLDRSSRWWDAIRVGALTGLAELEDSSLAPTFSEWTGPDHGEDLRRAALDGWVRAAPDDPALAVRLRELGSDLNRNVRLDALAKLGQLHRADDLAFLREVAAEDDDPDIARVARDAAETIESFVHPSGGQVLK
jgi:aminopeptidase N